MTPSSACPAPRTPSAYWRCNGVELGGEQQVVEADHAVHGRADLVAHGGEERRLGPGRLECGVAGQGELLAGPGLDRQEPGHPDERDRDQDEHPDDPLGGADLLAAGVDDDEQDRGVPGAGGGRGRAVPAASAPARAPLPRAPGADDARWRWRSGCRRPSSPRRGAPPSCPRPGTAGSRGRRPASRPRRPRSRSPGPRGGGAPRGPGAPAPAARRRSRGTPRERRASSLTWTCRSTIPWTATLHRINTLTTTTVRASMAASTSTRRGS